MHPDCMLPDNLVSFAWQNQCPKDSSLPQSNILPHAGHLWPRGFSPPLQSHHCFLIGCWLSCSLPALWKVASCLCSDCRYALAWANQQTSLLSNGLNYTFTNEVWNPVLGRSSLPSLFFSWVLYWIFISYSHPISQFNNSFYYYHLLFIPWLGPD